MDQLLIEIGDRIRRRRKQLGLTQEDLSNRTDVTTQTISNAELGLKGMRPDTIIRICRALEISTDYLLLGEIGDSDKSLFFRAFGNFNSQPDEASNRYCGQLFDSHTRKRGVGAHR